MILDKIASFTKKRVAQDKEKIPFEQIKKMALSMETGKTLAFQNSLKKHDLSFICEVKKASPSKGIISEDFDYLGIAKQYEQAGADAISVLTEPEFFCGSDKYLSEIKNCVNIPVLRKDFIIDPYQIYQSKIIGADAILLICALLDTDTIKEYLKICECLGLCALVEAHDENEVYSALNAEAKIIGVNNRNLNTFEVDITNCINLRKYVTKDKIFVSESGIQTPDDIKLIKQAGIDAVLIGETLMKSDNKKKMLNHLKG